jgi:hypothetical protein
MARSHGHASVTPKELRSHRRASQRRQASMGRTVDISGLVAPRGGDPEESANRGRASPGCKAYIWLRAPSCRTPSTA